MGKSSQLVWAEMAQGGGICQKTGLAKVGNWGLWPTRPSSDDIAWAEHLQCHLPQLTAISCESNNLVNLQVTSFQPGPPCSGFGMKPDFIPKEELETQVQHSMLASHPSRCMFCQHGVTAGGTLTSQSYSIFLRKRTTVGENYCNILHAGESPPSMSRHKYHTAGDTGTQVPRPSFPSHAACSRPWSLMLPTRASFPRLPPLTVHTAIQPLLTKSESLKPILHALAHQMTNSEMR